MRTNRSRYTLLPLLSGLVMLSGCGGAPTQAPVVVASVVVAPGAVTVPAPGGTLQFTAEARDAAGNAIDGKTFSWAAAPAERVTVDASGRATVLKAGLATVTASVDGKSGGAALTVLTGKTAGRLGLTLLEGIGGAPPAMPRSALPLAVPAGASGNDINLGAIRNTTNFYFLLLNNGGESVTDITIADSSALFEIAPATIDTLPGTANLGLLPVIRLTAVHGTASSGVGLAGLMNQGANATGVVVKGTTLDSLGGSIPVSLYARMTVTALVMDAQVFDGSRNIDLAHPTGSCLYCGPSDEVIRQFGVDSPATKLENTGNVTLDVTIWSGRSDYLVAPHKLAPGASETFTCPLGVPVTIELASGGTISDNNRLPLAHNGHAYVGLQRN